MPKGPQGQKRPGDVIGAPIMVAQIATGEIEDNATAPDKAHPADGGAFILPFLSPHPGVYSADMCGPFPRRAPARDRRNGQSLDSACPTGFRRPAPGKS
jgi:hypothetical protein